MGHEAQFPPPEPSARYRFGQATFAGTRGNERDALKAVTPAGRSFQKPNRFIRRFHLRSGPDLPLTELSGYQA